MALSDASDLNPALAAQMPAPRKSRAGRPTAEELERRKAVIIHEATRQFVEHGYAGANLVDIGRAAGVATRTLYQHFGDKAGIFREVMYAQRAVYEVPPIESDDSLFDSMMRIARYCCDRAFPDHVVGLLRLAIGESKRFPDMMSFLIETGQQRFRGSVQAAMDQLVASGQVEDENTASAAAFFLHLIVGDTALMILAGRTVRQDTLDWLEPKVELFIRGRWGQDALDRARNVPT